MKFTFGIITAGNIDRRVLDSIYNLKIPEFEVIVIGGESPTGYSNLVHEGFDDTLKPFGWITKKKNNITRLAKYDNIVFLHDYFCFDSNWYNGFLEFGDDWDICMNIIQNLDGTRFRDWCAWDDPEICYTDGGQGVRLPPYTYNKPQWMYISGSYWVAKKHVMEQQPLDESILWAQPPGEDWEWSKRVLCEYKYVMNTNSIVRSLKQKRLSARYVL